MLHVQGEAKKKKTAAGQGTEYQEQVDMKQINCWSRYWYVRNLEYYMPREK